MSTMGCKTMREQQVTKDWRWERDPGQLLAAPGQTQAAEGVSEAVSVAEGAQQGARTEWWPTEAELLSGYALTLRLQEAVAP